MGDGPTIRKPPPVSRDTTSTQSMAQAADIPRPSSQLVRDEQAAALLQQAARIDPNSLPKNLHEMAGLMKELEKQGKRVERNTKALMDFLKQGDGSDLSADVLVATAAIMAASPQKKREKKKRILDLYFKWARQSTTVLITKVIDAFKPKK